jgi:hypothetical protein
MVKYENTWRMKPHIVKRGAQGNLKSLGSEIISEFDKNPDDFGVNFCKDLVSKMILFRRADKAIQFSVWYKENKGLKAETVTYTLALIRHSILKTGKDINLDLIYQKQALSTSLLALIVSTAQDVKQHIEDPIFRDGVANQSEFCKSERGWKKIQNIGVDLSKLNQEDYIDEQQKSERLKDQEANIVVSKTISFTEQVLQVTETEWTLIAKYNASIYPPSHANVGIPIKCASFLKGGSMPSDRQLKLAIEIRKNAYSDGFGFLS